MAEGRGSWSVRARVTTGAVVTVGVALLAATSALLVITRSALENNAGSAARLRAQDFVALLESGTSPNDLHIRLEEDVIVQIVDAVTGEVVAASPFIDTRAPIAELMADESRTVEGLPGEEDDPFLVVAESASTPDGALLVMIGRNLDSALETTRTITVVLIVAVPLLLVVVGLTAWVMVGRALAPVESMRKQVSDISASELDRRIPDDEGDDEIARLTRTMNEMLARLEAAQKRQQRFVSDASHELRNPIAAIRQHVEVALEHPEQAAVAELAGDVLGEDLRLQQVAEDLLLRARADEGMLEMRRQPVDLDDLILDEARFLQGRFRSAWLTSDPSEDVRRTRCGNA